MRRGGEIKRRNGLDPTTGVLCCEGAFEPILAESREGGRTFWRRGGLVFRVERVSGGGRGKAVTAALRIQSGRSSQTQTD